MSGWDVWLRGEGGLLDLSGYIRYVSDLGFQEGERDERCRVRVVLVLVWVV